MILKGLSRINRNLKNIEASIENVGKIEIYNLEKNLSLLATISGAAPMIGFLGTVTGMIQAFISIAQEEGAVSPKLLSSGIYEASLLKKSVINIGNRQKGRYKFGQVIDAKSDYKSISSAIDQIFKFPKGNTFNLEEFKKSYI